VTPLPPQQQGEGLAYTAGRATRCSSAPRGAAAPVDRVVLTRPGSSPRPHSRTAAEQDEPLPWGPIAAGAGVLAVLLLLARRAHG
jgi:hypothetical protein